MLVVFLMWCCGGFGFVVCCRGNCVDVVWWINLDRLVRNVEFKFSSVIGVVLC